MKSRRRTLNLHAEKNDTKKTLWTKNCSLICQKLRKNIINLNLFSLLAVIGINKLAWRANVPGNHSSISASSSSLSCSSALSSPRWRGCHSPAYRLSGACSLSNPKEGVSHRATPWLLLANSGHLLRPPASEGQRSNKSSQAQRGWVGLGLGMGGRGGGGCGWPCWKRTLKLRNHSTFSCNPFPSEVKISKSVF